MDLTVSDSAGKQKTYRLENGSYSLSRGLFADIRLTDPSIAKRAYELEVQNDHCVLEGVRLNDTFMINQVEMQCIDQLHHDDVVNLGDMTLRFKFNTVPDETVEVSQTSSIASVPTDCGYADRVKLRGEIRQHLLKQLDQFPSGAVSAMSPVSLRTEASRLANEVIQKRLVAVPSQLDHEQLIDEVVSESIGLGPLEPLLEDDAVTEIMVNGPNKVYVERSGRLEPTRVRFIDETSLLAIIERIVDPLGRRIDESSPYVDARLKDGSRVNAIIPPLSLVGPVITIRKFAKKRLLLADLVSMHSLDESMAAFLAFCVEQKKNIVVSGGTGTGKTTFLNVLSDAIPECERIVTIEDAAELRLNQEHVISLETRPPNAEYNGQVTIRDLVRNALRMRPDRIIVGECRDGAAMDMLQAMNTGHEGSLTTGHANSPRDLLSRLEVMCLMSDIDLPSRALREQIVSAVDIIVQLGRFKDGSRRVSSIEEVTGMDGDMILLNKLYEFKPSVSDTGDRLSGVFHATHQIPDFCHQLADVGIGFDRQWFSQSSGDRR